MSAMIFLYVIMGTVAGYYSARLYRTLRGKEWKRQAFMVCFLLQCSFQVCIYDAVIRSYSQVFSFVLFYFQTATLFPGIVFGTCFILNFFVWAKASSGAVPFGTMVWLLVLWFGISLPLVYLGAYFGFRKPYQHPVRTNQIPRQVPKQPWVRS